MRYGRTAPCAHTPSAISAVSVVTNFFLSRRQYPRVSERLCGVAASREA